MGSPQSVAFTSLVPDLASAACVATFDWGLVSFPRPQGFAPSESPLQANGVATAGCPMLSWAFCPTRDRWPESDALLTGPKTRYIADSGREMPEGKPLSEPPGP
jgi:hypothetical protein